MKFNFLLKTLFLSLTILFVVSCDRDFNEIGSGLVDEEHFTSKIEEFPIVATNQATGPVQTNNLPVNSLGYLDNSGFGTTTSSFVTQLQLGTVNPTFYDVNAITIDSVYMYVPYFSHVVTSATTDTGLNTYALDSVIGTSDIKLSIYRSGYYLRNEDESTAFATSQKYFSNQQPEIDAAKSQPIFEENDFVFDKTERLIMKNIGTSSEAIKERLAPGIFEVFGEPIKNYFLDNIIKAPTASLINNNAFKQYFRGLYFKAENSGAGGAMARLNFAKGKIVIIYKCNTSLTDLTKVRKELVLNMTGNNVNFFQNSYIAPTNDDRIHLKGGEGNMAVISLFGGVANNASTELMKMREQKWLINEASITFNIEDDVNSIQPNRIYLYDFQNRRPLIDYYYDTSTSSNTKYNKSSFGGILLKADGTVAKVGERGTKYKFRITNYLRNLVKNGLNGSLYRKGVDSTNVKLGLVVTEAITNPSTAYINNPLFVYDAFNYTDGTTILGKQNKFIPAMSVVNPLGVKLYGANIPSTDPDFEKRMRLEIKYSKPN